MALNTLLQLAYASPQTVFTIRELDLLAVRESPEYFRQALAYAVRTGKLLRVRKGVYAKNEAYDRYELAARIYTPAYVSFETILAREGIMFQFSENIFVASYLSRTVKVGDRNFVFRKLKDTLLTDRTGLIDRGRYFEASRERAFLDTLYLFPGAHFDNLRSIDWERCATLLPLYTNRRLKWDIETYRKEYAQ